MELREIIDNRLKELEMSYYRLSKLSGVHINTLYGIKNGSREEFNLKNTLKIFYALELDLNELWKIDWEV